MAAKAEEIPPAPAAVAGGVSEEPPLEEAENREGARLAKRRRTFPATLETLSSPAAEDEGLGESGRGGFSFSFDARNVAPIETTPKFGSFYCSASDLGSGESALIERTEVEEDQIGKAKRRRTSLPVLETRSAGAGDPEAAAGEEDDGELGRSARGGFSLSFDSTPKFGSFRCAAADPGSEKAETGEGGTDGCGGGRGRGGGDGKFGI